MLTTVSLAEKPVIRMLLAQPLSQSSQAQDPLVHE